MPKPTRDWPRLYQREITRLDERIAKLQSERHKLAQAYALITDDETTFGVKAPSPQPNPFSREARRQNGANRRAKGQQASD